MPREALALYHGQTCSLGNAFLCARRFFVFNEQLCGFFVQNKCNVSTLAGGTKALLWRKASTKEQADSGDESGKLNFRCFMDNADKNYHSTLKALDTHSIVLNLHPAQLMLIQ